MSKLHHDLADVILAIEAELRRMHRWEADRPAPEALASSTPFCVDTLAFSQWLQWLFLPRMRQILQESQALPRDSNIHAYAEESLKHDTRDTAQLVVLIQRFDALIRAG